MDERRTPPELQLLTEAEAAEILRMKKDTLRKKRREGRITAIKDRGTILYRMSDLHAYLSRYATGESA